MSTLESIKTSLSIGDSFLISLIGFAIVFFVLIALMFVVNILRSVLGRYSPAAGAPGPALAVPAPAAANMVPAAGSLGEVKLHDVDDRTAAILMAIVADELGAPLNELRFISIREKR